MNKDRIAPYMENKGFVKSEQDDRLVFSKNNNGENIILSIMQDLSRVTITRADAYGAGTKTIVVSQGEELSVLLDREIC